eukprot:TRINITY_DN7023_c0_g1_i1.p1 TRINITY_DN7023_c0_g1~~TRINITY_DN7023_c0_g1_i1.p1  ORF type:complete len:182 (-),score=85.09 TRINITY_DN7023_c0_g1_i1:86-631(-)
MGKKIGGQSHAKVTATKSEKSAVKTGPQKVLTKKEKQKQKRDKLLANLAKTVTSKNVKEGEVAAPRKKNQSKLEVIKDLKDALPNLSLTSKTFERRPVKLTQDKRQKIALKETKQFKDVVQHPQFKKSPLATITEHLTNSVALMVEKEDKERSIENAERKKKRIEDKRKATEEKARTSAHA